MKKQFFLFASLTFLSLSLTQAQEVTEASSDSQKDSGGVFVAAKKIKDSLYYLTYRGNNVVAFLGRDYTVLVDGHDENAAPQTLTTAGRLSLNPVRFLINTHHHKNQTGGNAYYSDSGVTILCNEQTYINIWADTNSEELDRVKALKDSYAIKLKTNEEIGAELQTKIEKLQSRGLEQDLTYPAFLFGNKMNLNLVNENIEMRKIKNTHTSSDVIVWFKNNNVLACGDLFFNGKYPYIDEKMGGNIDNYLIAITDLLKTINNDTVIVPGYGPIASKKDFEAYKRMIEYTQKGVQMDYLLGKSLEEVLTNKSITANFDALGYGDGNVKTQDYLTMLYRAAKKRYPRKN
jgi:cyclase